MTENEIKSLQLALEKLREVKSDIEAILDTDDSGTDGELESFLDLEQHIENEEAGCCMREAVDDINGAIDSIEWII